MTSLRILQDFYPAFLREPFLSQPQAYSDGTPEGYAGSGLGLPQTANTFRCQPIFQRVFAQQIRGIEIPKEDHFSGRGS